MPSEVKTVAHGSTEYFAVIDFRLRILRTPLGLAFSPEEIAAEADEVHLAILEDGAPAASLNLVLHGDYAKMRQVAVEPALQRRGLGRKIVLASEEVARERGFHKMVLHARATAVPFYESLDYSVEGEPFEEVTLPHRKMFKRL